jgi:hypothetical protein
MGLKNSRQLLRPVAGGLIAVLAAFVVAGCGDYITPGPDKDPNAPPVPHTPVVTQGYVATAPAAAPADPTLAGPDPLAAGGDPLASGDPLSHSNYDGKGDALSGAKNDYLLYWVVGSVQQGSVSISVNGVSIGTFTGNVDKEISMYCHDGANTVTITHHGAGGSLAAAHFDVLDGNSPKGSPPVLTYDSTQQAMTQASAPAAPTGGMQSPSAVPESAASSAPVSAPRINPYGGPSATSVGQTPPADTRMFFAHPYQAPG